MIDGSHALRITSGQFRSPNLRSDPALTFLDLQNVVTPSPATHPQNPPITPFAATHTILPSRKSFPCHTYKKQGGVPCGTANLGCGPLETPSLISFSFTTSTLR